MYTPKRFQPGRPSSPYTSSPYQSLNVSKDLRDTPNKGYNRDTPSKGYQVLGQDDSYQLLTYGGNLPVKVAEVLSAPDNVNISAKIENSGWAYIIDSRKLYAWKSSSSQIKKTVSCFEFQLAASIIPHKSSLTCVLESSPADSSLSLANKTSLLSVSPEGVARFWQNITQPALMVESLLNIGDKQCASIQSIMPYGCILVTATNEIYHLSPSNSGITYHQVAVSSGMLSNIGKRMSSFWSQPVVVQSNFPPSICNGTLDFDAVERHVFVSLDRKLQKWEFSGNTFGASKMIFEVDLLNCANNYAGITEFSPDGSIDEVQTIDMKNTGYGTVLLLALWIGEEYKVVLGILKVNVEESVFNFERLIPVDFHEDVFNGNLALMVPFPGYQAYISTKTVIISQPVSKSTRNPIKLVFHKANSGIIGAGSCGSDAIYLSKRDGLVNLKVTYVAEPVLLEKSQAKYFNDSSTEDEQKPSDVYSILRSMFISHSQGKVQNIVNLASSMEYTGIEMGAAIMKLDAELLDSYPPSDPRWASSNAAFSPSSVLLLNQLRDKEKIHEEYQNFLSIYDLLGKVGEPSDEVKIYLRENAEKLKCAIALLDIPGHLSSVVDDVINSSELDVQCDEENVNRKDAFFEKISGISYFFSALKKMEEDKLSGMLAIKDQVELILSASQIITSCFQAAWQYRQNVPSEYLLSNHVPWTGSTAGTDNRLLLKYQIDLVLSQALSNVDSTKVGSVLTQQVVLLADLLFDGYLRELANLKAFGNTKEMEDLEAEYNEQRNKVIMSLVNLGYFEESATLAEHYKDFYMLIFLCERTNDTEKLKQYKAQFKNEGFGNVLYKWYMEKGAWSQLMTTRDPFDNFDSQLSSHRQLNWVHFIGSKEYTKASDVLSYLAAEEKEYCARKKSMLVLANLAILAAEEPVEIIESKMSDIDRQVELLNYQEQIFKELGKTQCDEAPPLSAEELIQLSLGDVSILNERQYITLVELLKFLSMNQQQFLLDIWSKCILQDSWEEAVNIDSVAGVSQKIFFKCLKYWKDKGASSEAVPFLKDLVSSKLVDLPEHMLHQLKVCYEALSLQELSAGV